MTWKLARSKPGRGRAEMQGSSVPLGRNHVSPSGGPLPSWALRIVLTFPPLTAPLATAIAGCLSKVIITSHMSPFWTFCARAPPGFENEWTYSAWECSALREVHIVLDTNKTYPKRRDYLFSFNLNLDLFTLALENLYFNTLDREKVQGKSLGCIKSLGTPHPHTPIQGATAKGWKSRMRLGSRGLPTPGLDTRSLHYIPQQRW